MSEPQQQPESSPRAQPASCVRRAQCRRCVRAAAWAGLAWQEQRSFCSRRCRQRSTRFVSSGAAVLRQGAACWHGPVLCPRSGWAEELQEAGLLASHGGVQQLGCPMPFTGPEACPWGPLPWLPSPGCPPITACSFGVALAQSLAWPWLQEALARALRAARLLQSAAGTRNHHKWAESWRWA